MAITLRNNITVDTVELKTTVKSPAEPTFERSGDRDNAIFHFSTAHKMSQAGRPGVSAISIKADVTVRATAPGQPAPDFTKCTIRFMQTVNVEEFAVHFAGTRNSEGSMTYRLKEPFINTYILDCSTDNGPNFLPLDYPFLARTDTVVGFNAYNASMNDSPGFNSVTREMNTVTNRWNYLWRFKSTAKFFSILVFQHADGTLETLEMRQWTLRRVAELQWRPSTPRPTVDTPRIPKLVVKTSDLKPTPNISTIGTGDPRDILNLGRDQARVMNKIGNEAQSNFRTSPNMWFKERAEYADGVNNTFWK